MSIYNEKKQANYSVASKGDNFIQGIEIIPVEEQQSIVSDIEIPIIKQKKINKSGIPLTTTANILTGLNTVANVAANIYGVSQAMKSKPTLVGYTAPIEPTHVKDNTELTKASVTEQLDKSFAGINDVSRRYGRIAGGDVIAKNISAINELGGKLAEQRTAVDAQNANVDNSFKQFNAQTEAQRNQFNAQIQNNFDAQKTNIISAGMSGISKAVTEGTQGIVDNLSLGANMKIATSTNELNALRDELQGIDLTKEGGYKRYQEIQQKIKEVTDKKNNDIKSIYGK